MITAIIGDNIQLNRISANTVKFDELKFNPISEQIITVCKDIGTFLYVESVITNAEIVKAVNASEDKLLTVFPTFLAKREPKITQTLNKINKFLYVVALDA